MTPICIRCWLKVCWCMSWCKCTQSQIDQYKIENDIPLSDPDILTKEDIIKVDISQYKGLEWMQKVMKYMKETWKDFLSDSDLELLKSV